MHLIQIFLPVTDNEGTALPKQLFSRVRDTLVERFGGLTAYARAPASGMWAEGSQQTVADDLVVYEVVVDEIDRGWWRQYLGTLESEFRQERLHVRALALEVL
jgi:hypothetical protein